jgi:hypothetical protein
MTPATVRHDKADMLLNVETPAKKGRQKKQGRKNNNYRKKGSRNRDNKNIRDTITSGNAGKQPALGAFRTNG